MPFCVIKQHDSHKVMGGIISILSACRCCVHETQDADVLQFKSFEKGKSYYLTDADDNRPGKPLDSEDGVVESYVSYMPYETLIQTSTTGEATSIGYDDIKESKNSQATSGYGGSVGSNVSSMESKNDNHSQYPSFVKSPCIGRERKVKRCFRFLKEEVEPRPICDHMIAYQYFKEDDAEEIRKTFPRSKAVTRLLLKVIRLPKEAYEVFLTSLKSTGYEYVASVLEDSTTDPNLSGIPVYTDRECLHLLEIHKDMLLLTLDPNQIMDFFIETDTFSPDEYEDVFMKTTKREQVSCLMKHISKKVPDSFSTLLYALRETCENEVYACLTDNKPGHVVIENKNVPDDQEIIELKIKMSFTKQQQTVAEIEHNIQVASNTVAGHELINKHLDTITSVLKEARNGSVVFLVKPTCTLYAKDIKAFAINGGIKTLIESLVRYYHGQVEKPKGVAVNFSVEVECAVQMDVRGAGLKEVILDKKEFLLEELDALILIGQFLEKEFLSDDEAKYIIQSTPQTRRARTDRFLDCIMEKRDADIGLQILIEALQKNRKENVLEIIQPKSTVAGNDSDTNERQTSEEIFLLSGQCSIQLGEEELGNRTIEHCSTANLKDQKSKGLVQPKTETPDGSDIKAVKLRTRDPQIKGGSCENPTTEGTFSSNQSDVEATNINLRASSRSTTSETDSGYPESVGSSSDKDHIGLKVEGQEWLRV